MTIFNVTSAPYSATGNGSTNDRTAFNAAIAAANAAAGTGAEVTNHLLEVPPGRYVVAGGAMTQAHGNYSIRMHPGAVIAYNATGFLDTPMWKIGRANPPGSTIDGKGYLSFEVAAEGDGAGGSQYGHTEGVAFDFINISHFYANIRAASEFHTGVRFTADAESDSNKHMYDARIDLGYLHSCQHNLVQRTRYNGWMNNMRYYDGDFFGALSGARYINVITEGVHNTTPRGGENKAHFYGPMLDGSNNTALYVVAARAHVEATHMEDPDWVIYHEPDVGAPPGGEPSHLFMPGLEAKQFLINDPDNLGSYAHDPAMSPAPTPRPKLLTTGTYDLQIGDIRGMRMFYTTTTTRTLNVVNLGSGALEPALMAQVMLAREGSGGLNITADSGVSLILPTGKQAALRAAGSTAILQLRALGATHVWALYGDLADA
jgi:hypothetical protein